MPVLLPPEVVMSAVDVIVTNPPLEEANMPFAFVVMMPNGLVSTFSVTLPLLVNSTPGHARRRRDVAREVADVEHLERA